MRIFRRFVIALALAAISVTGIPQADAFDNHHRRPRSRDRGEYRQRDHHPQRQYRTPHRQYRPYRPHYRYHRPYHHYWSPRHSFTCRIWIPGYWDYDDYGEYWVSGHYGYILCR